MKGIISQGKPCTRCLRQLRWRRQLSAASRGVLNPSFPHSLDHARASTGAVSLRSSIIAYCAVRRIFLIHSFEYVTDELEYRLVDAWKFKIVDRRRALARRHGNRRNIVNLIKKHGAHGVSDMKIIFISVKLRVRRQISFSL